MKYMDAGLNVARFLEKEGSKLIECSEKLGSQEEPGVNILNHIVTGVCYNEHWKINKCELDFLVKIYKSKIFSIEQKFTNKVEDEIKEAEKHLKNLHPDKCTGDSILLKHLHSHYIAMLDSAKAYVFLQHENYRKCLNTLSLNPENYTLHPICEGSNIDSNIKSLSHPCIFFNNIGVAHLKMKKYALALFYFKKAYKNIPKRHKLIETNQLTKSITNHSSNIRYELRYNMGLSRYLLGDYVLAFQCFEQSLTLKKDSYQLWYRMGLCCIKNYITNIVSRKESHSVISASQGYEGKPLARILLSTSSKEGITIKNNVANDTEDLISIEDESRMSLLLGRAYLINSLKLYKYKRQICDNYKAITEKIVDMSSNEPIKEFASLTMDIFALIDETFIGNCITYICFISLCINDPTYVIKILGTADYSKIDPDKRYLLDSYLVEAYIRQNSFALALEHLEKNSAIALQGTALYNVIQMFNCTMYSDVAKKMMHYLNISTLHLMNGNIEQAQRSLEYVQSMFSLNASSGKEIPIPVLNCLIYLNMKIGRNEIALELLKKRRMPSNVALKFHNQAQPNSK